MALSFGVLGRLSTIACESDILKNACQIDFKFWYGLNTTKSSHTTDFGNFTKNKMAATAVWIILTLYPMQDIAFERGSLKTAYLIDFLLILSILWKTKWLP